MTRDEKTVKWPEYGGKIYERIFFRRKWVFKIFLN